MSARIFSIARRHPALWLLLSLSTLLAPASSAGPLDWMTREEMQQLPASLQRPIHEWCSGTYYAPEFADPTRNPNTIIEADDASYNDKGLMLLSGNVTIQQPMRQLSADRATFNQQSGDFWLDGNIIMDGKHHSFVAQHLEGNTQSRQTRLGEVRFALFEQHARGEASHVERRGNLTLIDYGSYTTCAPGHNYWKLAAHEIRLDKKEGWGTAEDVTLQVYDVPIFYLPWITFPIDDRRKSGLLFPTFATSDNGGLDYTQPIYINIAPQLDMTIAPRFINDRGIGIETQTRYLTHLGEGHIDYAHIQRDEKFHNQSRRMARWQHHGSYGHWAFGSNVNYVSDDFYFKDLGSKTLDNISQTELPRSAYLMYSQLNWRLTTRLQSWQVIDPVLAKANYPYRRLPQITLTAQPDIYGPVRVDWTSEYTYFDRGVELPGGALVGSRFHLQPAFTLPFTKSWGYLKPRMRIYSSYYELNGLPTLQEDSPTRTLVGYNLDAGLFFERQLDFGDEQYLQTLEPRLFYNYIPYRDQSRLPTFDTIITPFSYSSLFRENRFLGYDRIGDVNKLSTGLTSRIIDDQNGNEIWRFRVGQGFYFDERKVHLDPNHPAETIGTTPVVADATFRFNDHWNLYAQKQWDNGTNLGRQNIFRFGYHDPARRYAYIGYRGIRTGNGTTKVSQGELAGMWPVSQHWSLFFSELFDLDNHRSLETVSGVEFRNCCVKIRLVNRRLLADYDGDANLDSRSTLMFQIQLIGLGGLGDKVDSLMENTIPGYRREDQ